MWPFLWLFHQLNVLSQNVKRITAPGFGSAPKCNSFLLGLLATPPSLHPSDPPPGLMKKHPANPADRQKTDKQTNLSVTYCYWVNRRRLHFVKSLLLLSSSYVQAASRSGQLIYSATVLLVRLKGLWQRRWKAMKEGGVVGGERPAVTQREHNDLSKSHHRLSLFLFWLQPPANRLVISLLTCHIAGWHDELERTLLSQSKV